MTGNHEALKHFTKEQLEDAIQSYCDLADIIAEANGELSDITDLELSSWIACLVELGKRS